MRVREYSEAIALDRGEPVEQRQLGGHFGAVLQNYLALIKAQKRLTWFTVGFGQAAVVFLFVVAAPRFFSGAIQLGELMQIASAFGRVQDALSWFVDNYDSLARWRATTDRLTGFEDSLKATNGRQLQTESQAAMRCASMSHARAAGRPRAAAGQGSVAAAGRQRAAAGARRAAASRRCSARWPGIWPYAGGSIELPDGLARTRCSCRSGPISPTASCATLAYPAPAERYGDDQLQQALRGRCCRSWPTGSMPRTPGARSSRAASSSGS